MVRRRPRTSSQLRLRHVLVGASIVAGCSGAVLLTTNGHGPAMASNQLISASSLTATASTTGTITTGTITTGTITTGTITTGTITTGTLTVPALVPPAGPSIQTAAPATSASTTSSATPEAATAPPTSAPVAVPPAQAQIDRPLHTTGTVNVRDAPGPDGAVIAVLDGGQSVVGGQSAGTWVPIHAGDIEGWVSADYLADGAVPGAAPTPESSGNWMTDLLPQVDPGGSATWVFERNGSWGASDGHTVWIDPDLPSDKRFSVMVHEYSHVLQVRVYGSLDGSVAGLSALIGGGATDVTANESTADCMALTLGASWINYGCRDSLQAAAAAILAGQHP